MNKLTFKKKITSEKVLLDGLEKFVGFDVNIEVTALKKSLQTITGKSQFKNVAGALKKYKNKNLISLEKEAWAESVKEKYENS